jgi:hypothetical protein
MNQSKLYIPNPQKWIHFFKNSKNQVGKGLSIPSETSTESSNVTLKTVSPAEQTVEQAKSELKRDNINTSDYSFLPHNTLSFQTVKRIKPGKKTVKNRSTSGKRVVKKEQKISKPQKSLVKKVQKLNKNGKKKSTPKHRVEKTRQKVSRKGNKIKNATKQNPITTWDIFGN